MHATVSGIVHPLLFIADRWYVAVGCVLLQYSLLLLHVCCVHVPACSRVHQHVQQKNVKLQFLW